MKTNEFEVLAGVAVACEKNPQLFKDVIDAATQGVKAFAEKQADNSARFAYMLLDVIAHKHLGNGRRFTDQQVVEAFAPYFAGTEGLKELEAAVKACGS